MKHIFNITGVLLTASILCTACDKEAGYSDAGSLYDFEGAIDMDGFTWSSTSDIGIYALTDGVVVRNERCKIDGWGYEPPAGYQSADKGSDGEQVEKEETVYVPSKYDGMTDAVFHSGKIELAEGRNDFLVCAPYTAKLIYVPEERMVYDMEIPTSQTIVKNGDKITPLSLGLCSGNDSDGTFSFSLTPAAALIKVTVGSKEFEGFYLNKITVVGSEDEPISGYMDYSIDSKECSVSKSYSSVTLSIGKPQQLSSSEPQVLYLSVLPGTHTKDLTVTYTLSTTSRTVSLPVNLPAQDFVSGGTIEVNFPDLKSSDNNVGKWFCPVESRKLVGAGYAYGQANTFLIQCKSAVYNGAVLTPDPEIPEEVVIDYRLRGDYTKAEVPDGVTFEWLTKNGTTVYTGRTDGKFVADKYSFVVDESAYTVTVRNEASTGGAPILVMKKNGKILWGWTFWNIAADGTTVTPVSIGGYELANMAIGQPTTSKDWISKAGAGHFLRTMCYYQFGRYLPFFWDSYTSAYWAGNADGQTPRSGSGNMYIVNGPFRTLEESLEYPAGLVCHNGTDNMLSWLLESQPDLWGCEVGSPTVAGTKTQYDPCPKGWRVPDGQVSTAVANAYVGFNNNGGTRGLYSGSNDSEDYNFLFVGEYDGRKIGTNGRVTGYGTAGSWSASWPQYYWTNYVTAATTSNATAFAYWASTAVKSPQAYSAQHQKATAAPIRCQKDDDNR